MTEAEPTGPGVGGTLLLRDRPDPRVLHGSFTAMFALDVALRLIGGDRWDDLRPPVVGLLVAAVACVVTFVVPRRVWTPQVVWTLPVLEVGCLGVARLQSSTGAAAALIVVPAYWLSRQYGRRGAAMVLAACVLLLGLPSVVVVGTGDGNLSRALLLPVVAAWASLAFAVAMERTERQRRETEERGRALAAATTTIDTQRRFSEAILDTVDVGLVLLDSTGAYVGLNRRHRDFMRLAYPDGHAGMAGQLGKVYGEDGTTPLEREQMPTYRAAHGEEFDDCRIWVGDDPLTTRALSVSARTVRDDDGGVAGAALAYKDVTDFMRALEVKEDFVASVSHELRTPLTSIIGYVDLLLDDDDLTPEQRSHLEVVARNSDRLRRVVADLLQIAQIDEGLHIVRSPCDLSAIVRDCVEAARPGAQAVGVHLRADVPERLELTVDGQRMAQVIDNLVSNAVKYSPAGGEVEVHLSVDGTRAVLAVRDEGIGIAPRDRERLFTRFFRAKDAEERSIQGVGLGLNIVRSIVESHGGRIEVESEIDRGSTFRVRLPIEA